MTKARNYRGFDPDGVAESEADHFGNCPICGALLDMRDLGLMLAYVPRRRVESAKATSRRRAKARCSREPK
jgi:hypothetical protein